MIHYQSKSGSRRPISLIALYTGIAVLCSGPAEATDSAMPINSVVLASDAKSVRLRLSGGRAKIIRAEDAGTTFGSPRLSANHRVASWAELRRDVGSYDAAVGIAIYTRGHLRYVGCDGGMPSAWRLSGDKQVVIDCAFPHGMPARQMVLLDIETGKSAAKYDIGDDVGIVPASAPEWARGQFPE